MKRNPIVSVVLYVVVFILIQFVVTYAVFFIWNLAEGRRFSDIYQTFASGGVNLSFKMMIVAQTVFSLIALVVFLGAKWSVVSRSYLRSYPWAVLFWAAIAALGTLIPSEVLEGLMPLPDWSDGTLTQMLGSRWGFLAICILAPLVEELVFRGAILRVLLEGCQKHWVAIVISALLFAIIHANPIQMPHAFLMGLLLGWMYYRTRSVIPGILVHWVNNTVAYAVYNLKYEQITEIWGTNTTSITLAVVFSLLILIPAIFQLHQQMKPAEGGEKS